MADTNQYHVFFEFPNLVEKQGRIIHRYFRVRRKSGGGECGPLTRVNDNVYSVAFRCQEDQQAVLKRSEHDVELEDGPVVLTVRASLEPRTATAPAKSPQAISASTPPPSGEEEEELYLDVDLWDLEDDPKHDQELAAMACSSLLYAEEGRSASGELSEQLAAAAFLSSQDGVKGVAVTDQDALYLPPVAPFSDSAHRVQTPPQNRASPTDELVQTPPVLGCQAAPPTDDNIQHSTLNNRLVKRETFQHQGLTEDVQQQDQVSATKRLVVLGKTGSGKSNLANTIFGEDLFKTYDYDNSGTHECKAVTKCVNERTITFIDTPGFFDTERPEGNLTSEIVRCMTECAPGPHAFLIVLKVEKYTEHEKDVIEKCFSKQALKYAVVVFTHGDQLQEGMTIKEFVSQNKDLDELVKKCGGRCHVVDNKYWKDDKEDDYRSNRYQVAELLETIDKIAEENDREYFTNDMLEDMKRQIETEEENIRQSAGCEMSEEEITKTAKTSVFKNLLTRNNGSNGFNVFDVFNQNSSGVLLGAFLSVALMVMSRRI
ncbi:uncharacterized protein LOC125022737 isoform X2 [Mugil cephalus]|uniref:uncharacterized protein LOC125022737 isoform X2 n=1 Tax=Mugil cephalus TaxID=48193 RepID=UPI001FB7AC42|nr:uncharacterized protein LOC125022737 isoform X2 [Mugil cephalus]